MAILALQSGSHCHAEDIASGVASELSYTSINDKLFAETSRRFGVAPDNLQHSLIAAGSFLGKIKKSREKNIAYLRLVLAEMIQSDNVIVTGCPGLLIPRTISHA
ncbi:hypothetical protein GF377_04835, partial [candidate division GN15 bacterium]|nr:hypothetical protein [candidate division GN15 bacterium]